LIVTPSIAIVQMNASMPQRHGPLNMIAWMGVNVPAISTKMAA
jgi:hypothetical protein